jgi:hypothetical protein
MSKDTNAYTVDVLPAHRPGHYQWAIRRQGKLVQRADRFHTSEEAARRHGLEEIERKIHGRGERR